MRDIVPLNTASVPAELEPLFERAQDYVHAYFAQRSYDPTRGRMAIHGERYIAVRAASISIEFFDLVKRVYQDHREAERVARSLLFDVAHAIGRADARDFQAQMGLTDPLERLSAGPIHFAYAGWAFVEMLDGCEPHPDERFCLFYNHLESFEADAWTESGRHADTPVCVMNAGYSSGWSSASFDMDIVATELTCRGRGDPHCRFVMAPPDQIRAQIDRYLVANPELPVRLPIEIPGFFLEHRQREEELQRMQRAEAVGRLAGSMAHDFNNLLTVILGCAETLQSQVPAGDAQRNANAILQATLRASTLTKQLMALSRKQVLTLEVLDLCELVQDLQPLILGVLRDDITLRVELPDQPLCSRADRSQLEQVVLNLIVNARQAMPTGGSLHIRLAQTSPSEVTLSVQDTGVGMTPDVQRRATEPFFTTKAEGSGLGLSVAAGFARQFNGRLHFQDVPTGARVLLNLPLTADIPDETSEVPLKPPIGSGTVLVIDDNEGILDVLSAYLETIGCAPHTALSGLDAIAKARELPSLDAVISDLVMPGMDGPTAVAQIQRQHPGVRVLFMTGYAEEDRTTVPPGAPVLQKPFRLEAMGQLLLELLYA